MSTVKNDVSSLRNDLNSLKTEFGAKITAMEEGLKFAFPVNFAFDDATVRRRPTRPRSTVSPASLASTTAVR